MVELYYLAGGRPLKFVEDACLGEPPSLLFVAAEAAVVDDGECAGLEDVELEAVTEAKALTRSGECWRFTGCRGWTAGGGWSGS